MEDPNVDAEISSPNGRDAFILHGLPAYFTIGCDTIAFTSANQFPGFRDFPSGVHLIWIAPSGSMSTRSGYWMFTPEEGEEEEDTKSGRVHLKHWDVYDEVLVDVFDEEMNEEVKEIQKESLEQNFANLYPYGIHTAEAVSARNNALTEQYGLPSDLLGDRNIWYQLTFAINQELLTRITGEARNNWNVTTSDSVAGETVSAEETSLYSNRRPGLQFIFPMNARLINPLATGSERTRQALDPSGWVIEKLEDAASGYEPDDLTGEFQFAFLAGAHLANLSCAAQWFYLAIELVFRSYSLATDRPQQARSLIQVFHAQLLYNDRYLEGDIFELMPKHAHELRLALTTYKARLDEKLLALGDSATLEQKAVAIAFSSLQSWLPRLGWELGSDYVRSGNVMLEDGEMVQAEISDFEDEDERGEFAPAVVEMENGKEAGLVSWD
ncbi:A1 cistron-splicing factor [Astrocystis sublimbata]|nr:A1 cistron-splicing factor [Astrocystis sublimbata]